MRVSIGKGGSVLSGRGTAKDSIVELCNAGETNCRNVAHATGGSSDRRAGIGVSGSATYSSSNSYASWSKFACNLRNNDKGICRRIDNAMNNTEGSSNEVSYLPIRGSLVFYI